MTTKQYRNILKTIAERDKISVEEVEREMQRAIDVGFDNPDKDIQKEWMNKAVKEKVHDKKAQKDILELLEEQDIDKVFEYLDLYRNSLSEDTEIEYVEELIKYYENNREGLLPYQSQGLELPKNPDGLEYRNMGIMENHVWSVIEKRMKHNQSYQLEQAWRKSSGEDTGTKMQRKAV